MRSGRTRCSKLSGRKNKFGSRVKEEPLLIGSSSARVQKSGLFKESQFVTTCPSIHAVSCCSRVLSSPALPLRVSFFGCCLPPDWQKRHSQLSHANKHLLSCPQPHRVIAPGSGPTRPAVAVASTTSLSLLSLQIPPPPSPTQRLLRFNARKRI